MGTLGRISLTSRQTRDKERVMKVIVELESIPNTGYRWVPDREPDVVDQPPLPMSEDKPLRYGGSTVTPYVFSNVEPGTILTFSYRRRWEKDSKPANVVRVLVEND